MLQSFFSLNASLVADHEREGTRCSVCQINTFTDDARNDLITLSQYTCVQEVVGGEIQKGAPGQGGQTKREITKSHSLLWDISRARILMYHEEHSLLNGHLANFFMLFIHYSKTQFHQQPKRLLYFCYLVKPQSEQIHNQRVVFIISLGLRTV